jgi:hypothetical protein
MVRCSRSDGRARNNFMRTPDRRAGVWGKVSRLLWSRSGLLRTLREPSKRGRAPAKRGRRHPSAPAFALTINSHDRRCDGRRKGDPGPLRPRHGQRDREGQHALCDERGWSGARRRQQEGGEAAHEEARRSHIAVDSAPVPFGQSVFSPKHLRLPNRIQAYLDRGNLGNARLQGLQATILKDDDVKYDIVLSAFYIT